MDSGGGRVGMHYSVEFCMWAAANGVCVFALPAHSGKFLMTLDQQPHRTMEACWNDLKVQFIRHFGKAVAGVWQTIPLVRQAWIKGMETRHMTAAAKTVGLLPWNPGEVLQEKHWMAAEDNTSYESLADKPVFTRPKLPTQKNPCSGCKQPLSDSSKYCPNCGKKKEYEKPAHTMAFSRQERNQDGGRSRTMGTWTWAR